jgi:hypothetical protein
VLIDRQLRLLVIGLTNKSFKFIEKYHQYTFDGNLLKRILS